MPQIRFKRHRKPWERILLLVGSLGPLGHAPASGSVSVAVVGVPLAWVLREYCALPLGVYTAAVVAFGALAVWVHDLGDRLLGENDSRTLVLDELVGFFVAVAIMPWTWQMVAAAFLVERTIDIVKVPPANLIERNVAGGLGVVGDDVVAGGYTLLLLLGLEHFQPLSSALGLR